MDTEQIIQALRERGIKAYKEVGSELVARLSQASQHNKPATQAIAVSDTNKISKAYYTSEVKKLQQQHQPPTSPSTPTTPNADIPPWEEPTSTDTSTSTQDAQANNDVPPWEEPPASTQVQQPTQTTQTLSILEELGLNPETKDSYDALELEKEIFMKRTARTDIGKITTKAVENFAYEGEDGYNKIVMTINTILQALSRTGYRIVPSEEQLRVLYSQSSRLLIESGAGTGKTTIILLKIYIEQAIRGFVETEILAVTYTRAGAESMENRYNELLERISSNKRVSFSTIHSYCNKIRETFFSEMTPITEERDVVIQVSKYLEDEDYEEDPDDPFAFGTSVITEEVTINIYNLISESMTKVIHSNQKSYQQLPSPKLVLGAINTIIEMCITEEEQFRSIETYADFPLDFKTIISIREEYQRKKEEYNLVDYSDMLLKADQVLDNIISNGGVYRDKNDPPPDSVQAEYLRKQRELAYKFKSIYIDEVQDISPLQVSIINKLLTINPEANFTVIGDTDQSIYSFRGADVSFILNYPKIYCNAPDLDVIYLTRNRRSADNIIRLSDYFIRNNINRFPKKLRGLERPEPYLGNINIIEVNDSFSHHKNQLIDLIKSTREDNSFNVYKLKPYAVLYREHRQAAWFFNYLINVRCPYNTNLSPASEEYSMNSKEARDLRGMAIMLMGLGSESSNPDYSNIKAYLHLFIKGVSKNATAQYVSDSGGKQILKYLKSKNIATLEELSRISKAFEMVKDNKPINEVMVTLKEIYVKSYYEDFIRLQKRPNRLPEVMDYFRYKTQPIGNLVMVTSEDSRFVREHSKITSSITLNTYHISKGMEYDHVILLPLTDQVSPKIGRLSPKMSEEGIKKYIEEERRLLYVAMTRAKHKLTIFYTKYDTKIDEQSKGGEYLKSLIKPEGLFASEIIEAFKATANDYPQMVENNFSGIYKLEGTSIK